MSTEDVAAVDFGDGVLVLRNSLSLLSIIVDEFLDIGLDEADLG